MLLYLSWSLFDSAKFDRISSIRGWGPFVLSEFSLQIQMFPF